MTGTSRALKGTSARRLDSRGAKAAVALPSLRAPQAFARARVATAGEGATLILDVCGRIRFCSPTAAQLFGHNAAALVGGSIRSLIPDVPVRADTPGYNLAYARMWSTEGEWRRFSGLDHAANDFSIDVTIETMTMEDKHGFILALRLPADEAPHAELDRLFASVQHIADAVVITDARGIIEHVNPAFEALTGYGRDEAVGRTPRIVKSGAQSADFYAHMWSSLRSGQEFRSIFVNRKKDGETYHVEESIRPFVDRCGRITHYVATMRDVSARVRTYEHLDYLANHDSLTGLPNRNLFLDRLHQALARATRADGGFTLLCLDVDKFKGVNDRYGHVAGDELLRAVASRLKHCVRDVDTVARFGGDEFALILVDTAQREDVLGVLDKIMRIVGDDATIEEARVPLSVSIGVAMFPHDGHDERSLLRAADNAMYRAKATHGNCYRFTTPGPDSPSEPRLRKRFGDTYTPCEE